MKYSCLTCNRFHPSLKSIFKRLCILGCLALTTAVCSQGQTDLSSQYHWKPVRIGGGGFVVGMVLHPLDATVRYARTDVGSPYRWDNTAQEWYSMRVYNADGSGVQQPSDTDAPSGYGTDSIAVDPTNTSIVYMVFPTEHSSDIQTPTNYVEIYKSVDGGKNFTPGNMTASAIIGNPNGPNRADGEKLGGGSGQSRGALLRKRQPGALEDRGRRNYVDAVQRRHGPADQRGIHQYPVCQRTGHGERERRGSEQDGLCHQREQQRRRRRRCLPEPGRRTDLDGYFDRGDGHGERPKAEPQAAELQHRYHGCAVRGGEPGTNGGPSRLLEVRGGKLDAGFTGKASSISP